MSVNWFISAVKHPQTCREGHWNPIAIICVSLNREGRGKSRINTASKGQEDPGNEEQQGKHFVYVLRSLYVWKNICTNPQISVLIHSYVNRHWIQCKCLHMKGFMSDRSSFSSCFLNEAPAEDLSAISSIFRIFERGSAQKFCFWTSFKHSGPCTWSSPTPFPQPLITSPSLPPLICWSHYDLHYPD